MQAVHSENYLQCSPMSQRNERRAAVTSMFTGEHFVLGDSRAAWLETLPKLVSNGLSEELWESQLEGIKSQEYSRGISEVPKYGMTRQLNSVC